jgi:hypothetical protein
MLSGETDIGLGILDKSIYYLANQPSATLWTVAWNSLAGSMRLHPGGSAQATAERDRKARIKKSSGLG